MDFRKVREEDARLLFDWANDELVRANSFHSEPISWENHVSWLRRKTQQEDCLFLLFFQSENPLGIVRIEPSGQPVIGITVAPEQRGKGFASAMIQQACETFHQMHSTPITAFIKTDNQASLKAFQKAGFVYDRLDRMEGHECFALIKYNTTDQL